MTHSDSVVSPHQPAARYCAASALVTAAPSTPITRSYGRPSDLPTARGIEHGAQRGQRIVAGPVIDVHAAPLGFDESGPAQLGQMVADGRFGYPHGGREISTAGFAVGRTEQQ